MCKWIDVSDLIPQPNIVVVGMATTPDFAEKSYPCTVGIDPVRGWVTWPQLESCYVFHWKNLKTPCGHTVKLLLEEEK